MNSLVSIITPAYRAESFIARAVRSVLAQTYSNWEMIIISDDGQDYQSILASQNIVDSRLRFASTGRVKSGPAHTRNVGLDLVKGEFITPLDDDDELDPLYLEAMLPMAQKYGIAMIRQTHKINPDGSIMSLFILDENKVYPEWEILTRPNYIQIFKNLGLNKSLYNRKLLRKKYAENIDFGEDCLFDSQFFDVVDSVAVCNRQYYLYHYNENSLTNSDAADDAFMQCFHKSIALIEADDTISAPLKNMLLAIYHNRISVTYLYRSDKPYGNCANLLEFKGRNRRYFW